MNVELTERYSLIFYEPREFAREEVEGTNGMDFSHFAGGGIIFSIA